MLESKTGRERKAGGKNVCARICDRARKERERVGVIGCEKGKCERMRVREDESEKTREKTQEYRSTRRHAHVHSANTRKYIQIHTRDIYETQRHAILYIYDSIDDGAAHSHSVSRIVPQNFSFEFASRNLLFSNV